MVTITALNVYPVKSCKGIALQSAPVLRQPAFEHDRQWLIVRPNGQFVTQREVPRLALIETALSDGSAAIERAGRGHAEQCLSTLKANSVEVTCWRDRCAAFDMGDEAAQWLEAHLGKPHRLVRFDPSRKRPSSTDGRRASRH